MGKVQRHYRYYRGYIIDIAVVEYSKRVLQTYYTLLQISYICDSVLQNITNFGGYIFFFFILKKR